MDIKLIGIDLAKDVFQLHGVDAQGKMVLSKRLSRSQMRTYLANFPSCIVAMEACGGCFFWARLLRSQGHTVKIVPAQFVKPFLKSSKNDKNDSEAISEAAQRPSMRFVSIKELGQQDQEAEHNYRQHLVKNRTRLVCEMRALLHEYGVTLPISVRLFGPNLHAALEDAENGLTQKSRSVLRRYLKEYEFLSLELKAVTKQVETEFKNSEDGKRIGEMPGIGPISGSAFCALSAQAKGFRNGRSFAAWLGLVPNQYSSGNKMVLGRISKRGNTYLRTLLVHGARAVLSKAKYRSNITDRRLIWALELEKKKGMNKAVVALANKNARVIWHLLVNPDEQYKYA